MKSLLTSYFSRLGKSRVFWLCAAFMAVLAVQSGSAEFTIAEQAAQDRWTVILFGEISFELPCVLAVFAALFLGGEYDGGAIRSKLIVGRARWAVYGAALITVSATAALLALLYTGVAAALCRLAHGPMPDASRVSVYLAAVLLMCVSWSALFTAIGLNCARPAVSAAVCLVVMLVSYTVCASVFPGDILLHGNGPEAALSRFFYDLLPSGQGAQLRIAADHRHGQFKGSAGGADALFGVVHHSVHRRGLVPVPKEGLEVILVCKKPPRSGAANVLLCCEVNLHAPLAHLSGAAHRRVFPLGEDTAAAARL